jgi:hypothetical protein
LGEKLGKGEDETGEVLEKKERKGKDKGKMGIIVVNKCS